MGEDRRTPYFGDFVLFGEIGRGGVGTVYRAQQTKLDRTVALKVLNSAAAVGETGIQRFHIEAEAAAKLEHPNIVPIFEFGQHDGHPYLAMQLVEGESLAEYIRRLGPDAKERDAAWLVERIARAVHHAHQRGVLHRDLKPGNVLLDEAGEPHLIDFGLAKWIEQDSGMTLTGAFLGTPAYSSPEQIQGQNKTITTASDIYSLGAILYALLTGQAPFVGDSISEIIEKSRNASPRRPRALRPGISADLEVICLKCLEREPRRRYLSAGELAEDLKQFLQGKPIVARSVGSAERLWMWSRRNPVHAALWATGFLLVLTVFVGLYVMRGNTTREAQKRTRMLERELSLQEIRNIRLTSHTDGWYDRAMRSVSNALKTAGPSLDTNLSDLRYEAMALLAGLDAHRIDNFTNFGASSVRFDLQGKRLLIGGLRDGAKLWDESLREVKSNSLSGLGPVAFMSDGAPVQLSYDTNGNRLLLTDAVDAHVLREWELPIEVEGARVKSKPPTHFALTRDGSRVAAVVVLSGGREVAMVSSETSFRKLEIFQAPVTALAISPEGEFVVTSDAIHGISIWSIQDGRSLPHLYSGHTSVQCFAFAHGNNVSATGPHKGDAWLLAAGDVGGTVTVWDMFSGVQRARFPAGHYEVTAVAFSPDGVTLASGGKGPVKIWDISSERLLLNARFAASGEELTGLDFADGGRRLAISSRYGDAYLSHAQIWSLEFGRGIQTLRGLSGEVSRVCFSRDGSKVAAVSHNWKVGVWNLPDGRLLRTFEVPEGVSADNVALAFAPGGEQLAYSAGQTAKVWQISSGIEVFSLNLPAGLNDCLCFPKQDDLVLFRREQGTNLVLRRLLGSLAARPITIFSNFSSLNSIASCPNGQVFVAEGELMEASGQHRYTKVFDAISGQLLWSKKSTATARPVQVVDSNNEVVALRTNDASNLLVELLTGRPKAELPWFPTAISSQHGLSATVKEDPKTSRHQVSMFFGANPSPLISLDFDSEQFLAQIDSAGNQLAFGTSDGTVMICNLREIKERLARVGLQWK